MSPAHRGKMSGDWRVYADTPEVRQQIVVLAEAERPSRQGLAEGEYSRKVASEVLGIHKNTLRRWERRKVARPRWRDSRPIYTAEEIRRLRAFTDEGKVS